MQRQQGKGLLHPSVLNDNFTTNLHDQKAHLVVFELHFLMPIVHFDGHVHTRATSPPCLQKPL
jgi:hypothetical protein